MAYASASDSLGDQRFAILTPMQAASASNENLHKASPALTSNF
jgi:hypothetical protein